MGENDPVVAVVTRSGLVESSHRGVVVGLQRDGDVRFAAGDLHRPVFGRSSNKPLQAAAMVRLGLPARGALLAIVAASHSGEPAHLERVMEVLAIGDLDPSVLRCPAAPPLDAAAAARLVRDDRRPTPLHMNCSGKHAGMVVTCVINGWDVASYLDSDHPLQVAIVKTIAELAGEPITAIGVDGCGAPVHALSTLGLARAFRAVAVAATGSPEAAVAEAMRQHPWLVGGTNRDVTALLQVQGLLAKDGAEGVYAAALPDGRAVALKIDDGANRARVPVMLAALGDLGLTVPGPIGDAAVRGGDRVVGEIAAVRAWHRGQSPLEQPEQAR